MDADHLLTWLASLPPESRDAELERHLGIVTPPDSSSPGENLAGYIPSGVAPILRMLMEAPVVAEDVFIDIGAGLGKAVLLARLLVGATARGVELQPKLVERAREAAEAAGVDVSFRCSDAREAALDDGTVFYFWAPFRGPVLVAVLDRLRAVAARRPIVVCSLKKDFEREAPWLEARSVDTGLLTIYDSAEPGVPRRRATGARLAGPAAEDVAFGRPSRCTS
jgi:SAM-dependent methyltransferase